MKNIITRYLKLFPEEAFYAGLKDKQNVVCSDVLFLTRFENHLDFYEKNLYPLPFEKVHKVANMLFYSLVTDVELDHKQHSTAQDLLKNLSNEDGMAWRQALEYLVSVKDAYNARMKRVFLVPEDLIPDKQDDLKGKIGICLSTTFENWLLNLYGLNMLSEERMLAELAVVVKQPVSTNELILETASVEMLEDVIGLLFGKLEEKCPQIRIELVPEYMERILPVAAAYWFNRLDVQKASYRLFLKDFRDIPLAKLLLVVAHEVLGHINHFELIVKHCKNEMKKLPYLSRFPLTEGVALLAEELFCEMMDRKVLVEEILKIFGFNDTDVSQLQLDVGRFFGQSKSLRISRSLFEMYVYSQGVDPETAVNKVAKLSHLPVDWLREDLLSFLCTPGYASCYFGGYQMLKNRVFLSDHKDRIKLGGFGFDFADTEVGSSDDRVMGD